jgi:small subunit ribosomal protein S16
MLTIRMQRTGRKGHAMFRVVVQDSRQAPTSGKVVAPLGSYDPHAKALILDKEKAVFYLEHGAQPSDRVARLLKNEGVKLPAWVKLAADKERVVKNAEKRRSTAPAKPAEEAPAETEEAAPAEEAPADTETEAPSETPAAETPAKESSEETAPDTEAETPSEVPAGEAPAETPPEEKN